MCLGLMFRIVESRFRVHQLCQKIIVEKTCDESSPSKMCPLNYKLYIHWKEKIRGLKIQTGSLFVYHNIRLQQ